MSDQPKMTMPPPSDAHQITSILAGNKRAIARLITRLENEDLSAQTILSQLYSHTGQAHLVGVTGAPGTGKSTLVASLALAYRQQKKTVAIVAVDPTSPFSGGALLGDRVRMMGLSGDKGIFIRSMANRGNWGGLARTTADVVKVLDAAGYDLILIETVGAGQSEVDIVKMAQTVVVVEAPGLGDGVQAIKAGILEIADILVVNKADLPGADKAVLALTRMLEMGQPSRQQRGHHRHAQPQHQMDDQGSTEPWTIPVLKTVATTDEGIAELQAAISAHDQHLQASDEQVARRHHQIEQEIAALLQTILLDRFLSNLPPEALGAIVEKVVAREWTAYEAVQQLLEQMNHRDTETQRKIY